MSEVFLDKGGSVNIEHLFYQTKCLKCTASLDLIISVKAQKSKGKVTLPEARVIPTRVEVEAKVKMTGGTPEVRSDKSLTLMTFNIRH